MYYLNFKPESDAAWQEIAKTYTEQTGVPVKVVTAASGQYDTTLTAELDKDAAPTMFQVGNLGAVNSYGEFCYNLEGTDVYNEMTTTDFNLKNEARRDRFHRLLLRSLRHHREQGPAREGRPLRR